MSTPDRPIHFYENEYYCFSNFSSFAIEFGGRVFQTSEHLYQWMKFPDEHDDVRQQIEAARSAHEAKRIAHENSSKVMPTWEIIKVQAMRQILRLKIAQHPYVQKKLKDSGHRRIVENSHRDAFWGWGPDEQGLNILGQLWEELRDEINDHVG